jgi:hypothetical protein
MYLRSSINFKSARTEMNKRSSDGERPAKITFVT